MFGVEVPYLPLFNYTVASGFLKFLSSEAFLKIINERAYHVVIIFKEGEECVLYLMGLFIVLEPAHPYCV